MNARIMAYMVAAVAVGYILVAMIPQQVSMFAAPQEMLRTNTVPQEESGSILSSGTEEAELGTLQDQGVTSMFDMYKWWTVDLIVAFSVYVAARRRFV